MTAAESYWKARAEAAEAKVAQAWDEGHVSAWNRHWDHWKNEPNPYRTAQSDRCHDGQHVPTCAKLVHNTECDGGQP